MDHSNGGYAFSRQLVFFSSAAGYAVIRPQSANVTLTSRTGQTCGCPILAAGEGGLAVRCPIVIPRSGAVCRAEESLPDPPRRGRPLWRTRNNSPTLTRRGWGTRRDQGRGGKSSRGLLSHKCNQGWPSPGKLRKGELNTCDRS